MSTRDEEKQRLTDEYVLAIRDGDGDRAKAVGRELGKLTFNELRPLHSIDKTGKVRALIAKAQAIEIPTASDVSEIEARLQAVRDQIEALYRDEEVIKNELGHATSRARERSIAVACIPRLVHDPYTLEAVRPELEVIHAELAAEGLVLRDAAPEAAQAGR